LQSQFVAFTKAECMRINKVACSFYTGHELKSDEDVLFPGCKIMVTQNCEVQARTLSNREFRLTRLNNGDSFSVNPVRQDGLVELVDEKNKPLLVQRKDLKKRVKAAWARTIHTFQGSEVDHVVFVLGQKRLDRKLIYTACTRGRMSVTILGERRHFDQSLAAEVRGRRTFLKTQLYQVVRKGQTKPDAEPNQLSQDSTPLGKRKCPESVSGHRDAGSMDDDSIPCEVCGRGVKFGEYSSHVDRCSVEMGMVDPAEDTGAADEMPNATLPGGRRQNPLHTDDVTPTDTPIKAGDKQLHPLAQTTTSREQRPTSASGLLVSPNRHLATVNVIPCEICGEGVGFAEYSSHVDRCSVEMGMVEPALPAVAADEGTTPADATNQADDLQLPPVAQATTSDLPPRGEQRPVPSSGLLVSPNRRLATGKVIEVLDDDDSDDGKDNAGGRCVDLTMCDSD